jgi:hypothetical protein
VLSAFATAALVAAACACCEEMPRIAVEATSVLTTATTTPRFFFDVIESLSLVQSVSLILKQNMSQKS